MVVEIMAIPLVGIPVPEISGKDCVAIHTGKGYESILGEAYWIFSGVRGISGLCPRDEE
jgi:hypothetical protein